VKLYIDIVDLWAYYVYKFSNQNTCSVDRKKFCYEATAAEPSVVKSSFATLIK
jgi:hypothetical protein